MKTSDKNLMGRNYWRSIDELEDSKVFIDRVQEEFPGGAVEVLSPLTRRNFLTLMGASIALAGMTGCIRRPEENILPYSKMPEDVLPGVPTWYATAFSLNGVGTGLLVESHDGRPTKIEGNPDHPTSLGATDIYMQASVLELYDPDRATAYRQEGQVASRNAWLEALKPRLAALKGNGGAGLRFLSEASSSPTLNRLKSQLAEALPQAVWHTYEPLSDDQAAAGAALAFGQPVQAQYHLGKADVVLSVDSDFLACDSQNLRLQREFADRRRLSGADSTMNRLYAVEGVFTVTGGQADHRLRVPTGHVDSFLRVLAAELAFKHNVALPAELMPALEPFRIHTFDVKFVSALAADLNANRGKGVIMVGRRQPAIAHALAHALNVALGNVGQTVTMTRSLREPAATATVDTSIGGLAAALTQNQVDTLVMLGGNPAFNAPVDLDFANALKGAKTVVHLSLYENETSKLANWLAPRTHYLESWGDVRAIDGTASIVQPLVETLYAGLSDIELLAHVLELPVSRGHELVRATWQGEQSAEQFEKTWRRMLHDGVIADSAFPVLEVSLAAAALAAALQERKPETAALSASNMEIVFLQDPKVYDGRFANLGWMQELPDPVTKLTWDNAALMNPKTARELGVKNGDMIALKFRERSLELPVWMVPGLADYAVGVCLGYGRQAAGRVGNAVGFNAYLLRSSDAMEFGNGLTVSRTGATHKLATTQEHGLMEGRPIIREGTLEEYRKHPKFAREMVEHPPLESLFEEHKWVGQQWGMTIDLNVCTGCNTCVVACQAENNIPVVGKERVLVGREMHWIRLDRYFAGDEENPQSLQQPMLCQQCENAPCEPVCPVAATVHSRDGGLNDMVYNRCIGTRYCSNNCPFKVRRFNYFNYHEDFTEVEKLQQNPDVTVRMRGVMEKCTYCVQRINRARREAKLAGQMQIPDGAITPACAQACPSQAIVFGDVNDPNSRVSKMKTRDLDYQLLAELNIKPRTSYAARIRNPNPELG